MTASISRLCSVILFLLVLGASRFADAAPPQSAATDVVEADQGDEDEVDPKVYGQFIREVVAAKREAVEAGIADRVMDKQLARMDFISKIVATLAQLGLGLIILPLVYRKRFPGKGRVLWKYSALAALLFFVTVNLFSGVLSVLRVGQIAAGGLTNPQVQLVSVAFDVIDEKAEDLAPMGPVLIEPTLAALDANSEDPLPVMLLNNVTRFANELKVFGTVARFFKRLDWAFGYVPVILSFVTVAVFMSGLRPTLTAIVQLPLRAASGEQGVAREVAVATLKRVGRELLATLAIMVVLVVVMVTAGSILSHALAPALEAFIAYLGVAFFYVQLIPDASSTAVLIALGGTVLFLVLDLAVVLVAAALFVGKAHKIFQRRFHDKQPLGAHRRFWGWGTLSLIYALAFPLLFITAAQPVIEVIIDWQTSGDDIHWGLMLVTGPILLVVLFIAGAWLARVHRAIGLLARTKVGKLGTPLVDDSAVRTGETARYRPVGQ